MRLRWSLLVVVAIGLVAGCSSSSDEAAVSSARGIAPQRSADFSAEQSGYAPDQQKSSTDQQREVIRTAELGIDVDDAAGASAEVRRRAEAVGGYLEQEDSYRSGTTLTVRIPAAELDRALGELAALGRVTSRSQRAQDVTDQLVDTRSRIDSQRASVQRLRELMTRAETVADIVSIESEVTSRETELESLQRREAAMASQVQLATFTVRLNSEQAVADDDDTGFLAGLSSGWRGLTATGAVILTVAGAVLPFAAVLAVPAVGLHLLLRRRKALKSL